MLIHHDPDRYDGISTTHTCEYHKLHPGKAYAGCTCGGTYGTVRVSEEEYRRRRAERVRREEDEILARAEGIRARRAASVDTHPEGGDAQQGSVHG